MIQIEQLWTEVDGVSEVLVIARKPDSFLPFVGTVGVNLGKHSSGIRRLYVAGSERRTGIGTMLVEAASELAKDHGSETLGLNLADDNEAIWPFYKKLGFIRAYRYRDGGTVVCKIL